MKNIDDIMKLQPETLAKEQYNALKQNTLETLHEVMQLIKNEQYNKIDGYVSFSHSGDGYGNENHYIDFYYGDIVETVDKLKYLKSVSEGKINDD